MLSLESIAVHGMPTPLVAYNYKEGSGRLKEIAYANGDVMHVSYNRFGHPILEYWTDACGCTTAYYRYIYDNSGNLARSVDFIHQIEYTYTYEEGRVTRSTVNDVEVSAYDTVLSRTFKNSILYFYDEEGRLERTKISDAQGELVTYTHSYDTDGNATTIAYLDGNNSATISSSTDGLGREIFDSVVFNNGAITRNFFYHSGTVTPEHVSNNKVCGTATTNLVSKLQFSNGRTIEYWYDGEERITRVLDSYEGETLYTYDALGQLTSETKNTCPECSDCGTTVNITYDNYGNILTKGNHIYGYGHTLWKDRLTSFDGQSITYDAQGNPTNYLGHNLTWEKGRQLKSFDNIQYTYNASGIRISKTVDNVRHDYVVDGGRILKETWQGNVLIPIYNNDQEIIGIYYNCTPYYFYKNLQGDIIGISDTDGRAIVTYTYDAWGVCTVLNDDSGIGLANINPYRYRSYYYDTEIGMYYLQSRYYDPVVGRFVNADNESVVAYDVNILCCNLYCYCYNNPVNNIDIKGNTIALTIAKMILGAAFGFLVQLFSDLIVYFFRLLIDGKNASFNPSVADYIGTCLTWALSSANPFGKQSKIFLQLMEFVPVIAKYSFKLLCGEKINVFDIVTDFLAVVVSIIINSALNASAAKKVKSLKSNIKQNPAAFKIKKTKIEVKFKILGDDISTVINLSPTILQTIFHSIVGV